MKILEKTRIKNLELKNKIVFPALATNLARPDGSLSKEIIMHYENIAKSGSGLIIVELAKVEDFRGQTIKNQLSATSMEDVEKLRPLAETIHKYGAKTFLQIQHPGLSAPRELLGDSQALAPSNYLRKDGLMAREMTSREIQVLINKFALAGKIAELAGFDGVEIHAAHGYLLSQFLSPDTNKRTDEYGGNIFNRSSFLIKIIEGIRQFCREDFIISVRINGDDFLENGLKLREAIFLAKILEDHIDVINISSGTDRSRKSAESIIEPATYREGWKKNLAKSIRENISIPLIACNNLKSPQGAEDLFNEGVCDFVALGRSQLADYDFVRKIIDGEAETINQCISCLNCIRSIIQGEKLSCPLNKKL